MPERLTAGAALLRRLKTLGVDYVFCNAGTDFPPIIEALAALPPAAVPQVVVAPHEHAAMGMAHGVYLATGRAQAVMLHTNVGLANAAIGAINAACEHVPVLILSGRTPVAEHTRFGARSIPIGWGQDMRDQAALVREATKWDSELRYADQVGELLDRALAVANSTPKGPVYLSLPREVLCEEIDGTGLDTSPALQPAHGGPREEDIARLAQWIADAENPIVIAQRGAGSAAGFATLTALVEDWALPVCHYWPVAAALPLPHPMAVGSDPGPWLAAADLVLVVDSLAPWQPDAHPPDPEARIVHLGPDPLFSRFPTRGFRADLALAGETDEVLARLRDALNRLEPDAERVARRRAAVTARSADTRAAALREAEASSGAPMSKPWVSKCVADAIAASGRKASVVSELGCPLDTLTADHHNGYRQEPHSGGLGWGLPAALGLQLAEPDTLVFATMGDGSYIFANPTACHQIAEALALPVISLVLNNRGWGAVRQAVQDLYPDGHAARANRMPLTGLDPGPDFTLTAQASRAHTETVESGAELPAALERAVRIATEERRQVLLEIAVG